MFKRILVTLALGTLLAFPIMVESAQAQRTPVVTKGTAGSRTEADPNIKGAAGPVEETTRGGESVAPEKKGGPKARAALADLHVDNWTGWYLNIYVDGIYAGQVGPYGDIWFYVVAGTHTLYAKAVFHDLRWGPQTTRITELGYDWQLIP